MYLIATQKGGYQAIPIKSGDKWDFYKLLAGKREVRIILRLRGRRYMLYSTNTLSAKHPKLRREHLIPLCDEIIAIASERINRADEYIDFVRITATTEYRHRANPNGRLFQSPH